MERTRPTMDLSAPQSTSADIDMELVTPQKNNGRNTLEIKQLTPADFEPERLTQIYRTMLLSRRLDEKMVTLLKQGKGFFHIGCAGHEAAQAAVACYSRPGYDWFVPYYRDLCMALSLGMTSKDMLLAHLAKADDPNSGGRQMSEHFSSPEFNILTTSSSVGAQYLPALGAALAMQTQQAGWLRLRFKRRRRYFTGRFPRGPQLGRSNSGSFALFRTGQQICDFSACERSNSRRVGL